MGKSYWIENQQGNFSNNQNDTFDEKKRYIGLRLQQGVPLLDRDWNELEDIRRYEEQMLRKHYVGNGTPDDGFRISACELPDNDFKIRAGRCLVDGFEVVNKPKGQYICYTEQKLEEALTPPKDEDREDTVYLDVWIEEVRSQGKDDPLNNPQDLNEETTLRHRLVWRVRVYEGSKGEYKKSEYHHYYDIARIKRGKGEGKIRDEDITDLREARGKDKTTIQSLTFKNDKVPANMWPKLTCEAANQLGVSGDLIIKDSGNVGIGTSFPAEKLDVNGAIKATAFKTVGGTINGNLQVSGNIGITGTVDGVDISSFKSEFDRHFSRYIQFNRLNTGNGDTVTAVPIKLKTQELSFLKQYNDSKIEVHVNSRFNGGSFNGAAGIYFFVGMDDNTFPNFSSKGIITVSNTTEFLPIYAVFLNLTAGRHNVYLWANTNAGSSSSVYVDVGGWGGSIIVKECW